jgi:hypothetical protein
LTRRLPQRAAKYDFVGRELEVEIISAGKAGPVEHRVPERGALQDGCRGRGLSGDGHWRVRPVNGYEAGIPDCGKAHSMTVLPLEENRSA